MKTMYLMLHGERNKPLPQPTPPQSPPRNGLGWVEEEIEELQGQIDAQQQAQYGDLLPVLRAIADDEVN